MFRRYRDLLRILADTTDRPTILGPKERKEILERLRRLEQIEEELRQSEADARRLAREKTELEQRFARYRQRHPETVGIKLGKPYFLRRGSAEAPPVLEHGHPGPKIGHPPHLRPLPSHIDRRVRVPLRACPRCGGHRLSRVQELRHRFVEEIPPPSTVVTDYRIERRYCRDCARVVGAPLPQALPRARFGLRLMHLIAQLKIQHRLPTEQIPAILQFQAAMRDADAKYVDETSHSVNGDSAYLWVAATPTEAIFRVAPTRGHQTILDLLGPTPTGTVVHDRFSGYQQAARKTGLPQQVCWFHIIGDAKELAELHGVEGEQIRDALQSAYRKAKQWGGQGTSDTVRELVRALESDLAQRSGHSTHCDRFLRNLRRSQAWWFPFVLDPGIEGTNNRAERALRPSVVARKISGGNRSWRGARTFATLTSIVQTLRLRGQTLVRDGPKYLAGS